MRAYLILEDGTRFVGQAEGATREVVSEIVFNTSMTGYLEVLTDPSYAGQAVVMTYPLIGNYGVCRSDMESGKAWPDAFIVRELSRTASNFRSEMSIQQFLNDQGVPGISGIDTRALTKILREKGTMNGMVTTNEYTDLSEALPRIKGYAVRGVVAATTCRRAHTVGGETAGIGRRPSPYPDGKGAGAAGWDRAVSQAATRDTWAYPYGVIGEYRPLRKRVALLDMGAKANITRSLVRLGCDVTVFPAHTTAQEILGMRPDGIMLSNGPGDPKENVGIIGELRELYRSDVPIFAICLGHQLMALATGADTYKLKYGHRGGNHPVRDLSTGRVYISSQNHGYAVDMGSVDPQVAREAFVNVNDGTNEGLSYVGKNIFTVQYHPEACPGPQDSGYLFGRFMEMMER
ncbi:MAG: carbamoyl phosphate synthase small subunit [Lachnospiraceae bacterium]|jgi:carbamoyl-phosphate synthase small subunit|nr:carbamoyl phosphate synthase small subunit [Lachnospiraceae bacterium]